MIKPYNYEFQDTTDTEYIFECHGEFKYQLYRKDFSVRIFFDDFGVSKENELMLYQGIEVVAILKIPSDVYEEFRTLINRETPSPLSY